MRAKDTSCVCNGYRCLSLPDRNIPCPSCKRATNYDPFSRRDRYVVLDEHNEPVMYADMDLGGLAA